MEPCALTWAALVSTRASRNCDTLRLAGRQTGRDAVEARVLTSEYCWRNIAISNNVGSVKYVFEHTSVCTHRRAPFRSRRWFARFQPGLALNREGQELGPTQPSLRSLTAIKIPFIRTPSQAGSGMPNHYVGDLLLTIGIS